MQLAESIRFGIQALAANRLRTLLTALGLLIGNASVIWVVTISVSGRELILDLIRGLGSNIVYAYYESGDLTARNANSDFVKMADVEAVRRELGSRIVAATGVMTNFDRMLIEGREQDVKVIGSDEHYSAVRNLALLAGRFMDPADVTLRQKTAFLTDKLAIRLFGSHEGALGQIIKVFGLQFSVAGVFKERAESFGQSELSKETILVPVTVLRYFTPVERIDPMYVQARTIEDVPPVTQLVRGILESRHRPGAKYAVENLAAILDTASQITVILGIVLLLVAAIALVISGIGIMNIMLVTVTERTREIGVRLAVGASRRQILAQFLIEAVLISVGGGVIGILLGVAVPLTVRHFVPEVPIGVSWLAVAIAFCVSFLVGLVFGMIPANRASRLNPTEALRYE
ncbi:MAG: FtsX-like permease family protein [Acidobacteria bacterium]|nr:FtsX-like permease family protein [Acidobacteriota bacterium]